MAEHGWRRFFVVPAIVSAALLGCDTSDGGGGGAGAGGSGGAEGTGGGGGEPLPPLEIPRGCNPIAADADCLLPFPSDVFLADDPSLPSGKRVRISDAALLKKALGGAPYDMTDLHPADGWSFGTQILALFPGGVDGALLPPVDAPTDATTGPTVLIEAESGRGVLHFAELDPRADDPAQQALLVRPLERLNERTRYLVAFTGLRAPDGSAVPAPEGFRRIRDGEAAGDPILEPLAARYEAEIFPALEAAGLDRSSLQLAWDFTTQSEENVTRDMRRVRDLAIAAFEAKPPAVTVTEVEEEVDENVARRIRGTLTVPLFLDEEGLLFRGVDGQVEQNGTTEVPFTLQIPHAVLDEPRTPARFLQFGHGFFGSQGEADGSFVRPFIQATRMVVMTVDWWGMSSADAGAVAAAIWGRPEETVRFGDRVHQGMVNQIAVTFAAKTTLLEVEEVQADGEPLYDPAQVYFYGISQGHILGGTYLALSPHVERAVLSVGGADFSLMMFRARPFQAFLDIIELQEEGPLGQQKFAALTQTSFDRFDPLTYAPYVIRDPWPGSPPRRVLIQYGLGDAQVPNVATELHARAMGVAQLLPAARAIPGLEGADGPIEASAIAQFDFQLEDDPLPGTIARPPAEDNVVHEGVRRLAAGRAMVDRFLQPGGTIANTCDGICDPE